MTDLLLLRTGVPVLTIGTVAAYLLVLTLALPFNARLYGGIAVDTALRLVQPWAYHARVAWAELRPARTALWERRRRRATGRARVPRQRDVARQEWATGAVTAVHPPFVACANPWMCDTCGIYA